MAVEIVDAKGAIVDIVQLTPGPHPAEDLFREVNQYLERWPVQAGDALQEVLERRMWMGLPHPSTEPVVYERLSYKGGCDGK